MSSKDQFWLDDTNVLVESFDVNPFDKYNSSAKYNSLTRLIIIVTLILFLATQNVYVLVASVLSIVIVIFLHKFNKSDYFEQSNDTSSYNNTPVQNKTTESVTPGDILKQQQEGLSAPRPGKTSYSNNADRSVECKNCPSGAKQKPGNLSSWTEADKWVNGYKGMGEE